MPCCWELQLKLVAELPQPCCPCPPTLSPCNICKPGRASPPLTFVQDVRSNPWVAMRYYAEADRLEMESREMAQGASAIGWASGRAGGLD